MPGRTGFYSALTGNDPDADALNDAGVPGIAVNRSISKASGSPMPHGGSGKAKSNPELVLSIDALNHFQQRFVAGGGNQFSIEPPDQGLCVGNGFVLETLNDVLRVFDTAGNPLSAPTDLNSFYGYAPAIDRTKNPLQFGPSITDPSCTFDTQTQRWFPVVLTLDRANIFTQNLSGANHLDLAVSVTASPLGPWNIYRLPVQDDGTDGTPDHHCTLGTNPAHGPCLGDYPHMGADANGLYLTTNEFNLVSPGFRGAQIYAFSKSQLAAGASSVTVVQFDKADPSLGVQLDGNPGFTVWPALSTGNEFEGSHGGTEYFLSSEAVFQDSGVDNRLRLWTVSNSSSLNGTPAVRLTASVVDTIPYSVPPRSTQKPGDVPLAECLSDSTLQVSPTLFGCWRLVVGGSGPFPMSKKWLIATIRGCNKSCWPMASCGPRSTLACRSTVTPRLEQESHFSRQPAFGQGHPAGLCWRGGEQPDLSRACGDSERERSNGIHCPRRRPLSERWLRRC